MELLPTKVHEYLLYQMIEYTTLNDLVDDICWVFSAGVFMKGPVFLLTNGIAVSNGMTSGTVFSRIFPTDIAS